MRTMISHVWGKVCIFITCNFCSKEHWKIWLRFGLYLQRDTWQIYFSYMLWERKLSAVFCRSPVLRVAYKSCKHQELCSISVIHNLQQQPQKSRIKTLYFCSQYLLWVPAHAQFCKGCESCKEYKNRNGSTLHEHRGFKELPCNPKDTVLL